MSSSLSSFICMRRTSLLFSWQHACTKFFVRDVQQCTIIYLPDLIFYSQRDTHLSAVVHAFEFYKKCLKIKFSKYSQVWSCFEDLDVRNTMLQSKFNLDILFGIYELYYSNMFVCRWYDYFALSACIYIFFPLCAQTVSFIGLECDPPRIEPRWRWDDASPEVIYNRTPSRPLLAPFLSFQLQLTTLGLAALDPLPPRGTRHHGVLAVSRLAPP